jgi:SAM-dependent methyltransferase
VDFSKESLSVLQQKLSPDLHGRVHCIVAELNNLPVRGIRFDKIVSVQVIQHVPSHSRRLSVLRSFHKLLKKGGRLVFTVFRWNGAVRANKEGYYGELLYRYAFEPDEVKSLAEEAGFTGVYVRPLIVQHLRLRRFGLWTTYLDRILARFLNPKQCGQFLLVTAYKS